MSAPAWTPHGTLGGELAGELPFPPDIAAAAAELDLGPEVVELAWELARLAGDGDGRRARALLLLALALLAAQRAGLDAAGHARRRARG